MSNNNIPSKEEALLRLDLIRSRGAIQSDIDTIRAFISGAPDAAPAGEPAAVSRADFDAKVADMERGKVLLERVFDMLPKGHAARDLIAQHTGRWLVAFPEAADESTRAPDGWRQYAKEGETAQACIERHRREQDRLLSLLAVARAHSQALRELVEAIDAMPSWFEVEKAARITTAFQAGKALLAAPPSGERTSAPAPTEEGRHG